ncbi:hypothetical protein [Rhodococcus spongiicola]|uniref:Uncharacterized protein n=1 Tax=Rhodococcus spongiicola TaxID=2487352 RepID=A0A438B5F0_9NOCA|nr:hypothetical protein [Rhodococcus spongiicola]RVW06225.1 hypothetical protein EF834_01860 [Rhodococcus spongiicola]
MKPPSDTEIRQAAETLGLIEPGDPVPPRLRARVAKTIHAAALIDADDAAEQAHPPDFADQIATTHTRLIEAGLDTSAADRVVAAIAPAVWRDSQ